MECNDRPIIIEVTDICNRSVTEPLRARLQQVVSAFRMDETYSNVKGEWMYLYGAVDKESKTVDFHLLRRRNNLAPHKFLMKAINNNSCPTVIDIDKSGANREAIRTYN
jgi:putative transposase